MHSAPHFPILHAKFGGLVKQPPPVSTHTFKNVCDTPATAGPPVSTELKNQYLARQGLGTTGRWGTLGPRPVELLLPSRDC
jgi:hypothetical protein